VVVAVVSAALATRVVHVGPSNPAASVRGGMLSEAERLAERDAEVKRLIRALRASGPGLFRRRRAYVVLYADRRALAASLERLRELAYEDTNNEVNREAVEAVRHIGYTLLHALSNRRQQPPAPAH
jgi:class 3 adenylate cyclase